jgi:hypothetical protein
VHLRRKRRWGAEHIAHELGLAASTVGRFCVRLGGVDSIVVTGPAPVRSAVISANARAS